MGTVYIIYYTCICVYFHMYIHMYISIWDLTDCGFRQEDCPQQLKALVTDIMLVAACLFM